MRYIIIISSILFSYFAIKYKNSTLNKEELSVAIADPDTSYYKFRKLDLSQSDLKELPANLAHYKNIEELDLSNNPIEKLDASVLELKKLRSLKLNNCPNIDLENVISVIKALSIEQLEIKNCLLTYLPTSMSTCKSLKKLNAQENHIERFPEEIALFGRLNSLDLSKNNIDSLPEDFDAMIWLNHLDLSYNPCLNIEFTCKLISGLQNLETLKLNGAGMLTANLNDLNNLKELDLTNATIKTIPQGFALPRLRSLILTNCDQLNYETCFKLLGGLDSLENLELSSPKLKKIGDELQKFRYLSSLKIGENSLNDLSAIEDLPKLTSLKIQLANANQANRVFEAISKSKSIEALDLSFSQTDVLPASISKLKKLRSLNMEGMNLQKLPAALTDLKNLEELNIKGNNFEMNIVDELTQKLSSCKIIFDRAYAVPENFQQELTQSKENYTIDPANPNTITTTDGSTIRIPANAFVDKNGKPVKNNVTISFQPYYSAASIYLSGICMNYDSSGVNQSFISAGMFNVQAKAGESELTLKKDKKIEIDFKSNDPQTNYNYYAYNPVKKSWNYKGKEKERALAKKDSVLRIISPLEREKRINRTPRPSMHDYTFKQNQTQIHYVNTKTKGRRKYNFWIQRGYSSSEINDEVPEYFKRSNNWVYETDSNQKNFFMLTQNDRKMFNQSSFRKLFKTDHYYLSSLHNAVIDIVVTPDRNNDRFKVKIWYKNDSLLLTGYPDYGTGAAKVQKETRKDYEAYTLQREKRMAREAELLEKYKAELAVYEKQMQEYRNYLKQMNAQELSQINNKPVNSERIIRTMQLDQLGTWNCDIINRLPNGVEMLVNLYNNGKRVSPLSLTVIDKTNNGFGSFTSSKVIVDCFVNTIILAKISNTEYGYVKFSVNDKKTKSMDLALNVLDTKQMTMKEFSDQVFN